MSDDSQKRDHPLKGVGLEVKGFKSFGSKGARIEKFQPINIFIGKNNSGKSGFIDAIYLCTKKGSTFKADRHGRPEIPFGISITQELEPNYIQTVINTAASGAIARHDLNIFFKHHNKFSLTRTHDSNWQVNSFIAPEFPGFHHGVVSKLQKYLVQAAEYRFENIKLIRVAAERDVRPEPTLPELDVSPNGEGVTNIIRAFLYRAEFQEAAVEVDLLEDLNRIYKGDCEFNKITCQVEKDETTAEIFLHEGSKGRVRLSESGSSLKSIFIVLATLRLVPTVLKSNWSRTVFCLEEPENNLHPALLRRLLELLAEQRDKLGFTLCITTHSPIAIDWSAKRDDSQIIHVRHDGVETTATNALAFDENCQILEDLDARASDILQANGVIWVEGPTDRIYLRKWIEIISNGKLREGTHYSILHYGGRLLSHIDASPPEEQTDLIKILVINRNVAVVIDSDKENPSDKINDTKLRIQKEVQQANGFVWVTAGREIENYLDNSTLKEIGVTFAKQPSRYDKVSELRQCKSVFKGDKVELAYQATEVLTRDQMEPSMDLVQRVIELCQHIKKWNHISES